MSTFKARGIVLKETMTGESDKRITLLLKDYGKLVVSARGARKPKSKFLAGTQQFTYADFVIYNGGTFFSIAQIDVIDSFFNICNDFYKLCCGSYFLELCDKTILPGEPCNDILLLLLKTLTVLVKGSVNSELVSRVFEFKYLQLNGYGSELNGCCICAEQFNGYETFFYNQGILCRKCVCKEPKSIKVSDSALYALKYILNAELNSLYKFTVDEKTLYELKCMTRLVCESHLDVYVKSRELIE